MIEHSRVLTKSWGTVFTVPVVAALTAGAVVAACSSGTTPVPTHHGTSSSGDDDDDSTTSGGTSGTTPDSGSGTSGAAPNPCSLKTTADDCRACCGETATTFSAADAKFDSCACAGDCKTLCPIYCSNRSTLPTNDCGKCLEASTTQTACGAQADAVCAADATCEKVSECEASSTCGTKPAATADGGT